jgi:hypothetical protein
MRPLSKNQMRFFRIRSVIIFVGLLMIVAWIAASYLFVE